MATPPAPAIIPVFYDGTLPGPDGAVAGQLNNTDMPTHRQRTTELYQFWINDTKEFLQLNMDHTARTCLLGLPGSSMVRVLHTTGVGASGLGTTSAIDNRLLFLMGDEGLDIGSPLPLTLPKSVVIRADVITVTKAQFHTNLTTQGQAFTWPLVRRTNTEANPAVNVMQLAPIPSYLVLDGITKDLYAAEILERIYGLDDTDSAMFTHLIFFSLLALLTIMWVMRHHI